MASRMPQNAFYLSNGVWSNLLPPPPPPPPLRTSSLVNKTESVRYTSFPTPVTPRIQSYRQPNNDSRFSGSLPSSAIGNAANMCKRPCKSPDLPPLKKLKSEGDCNQETLPVDSSSNPSNKPSDNASTSRRNNIMTQVKDPSLPKELTKMFGPLKCDLCSVSVNSTVQAKMHYIGKQHEKKVISYLTNWCQETGQPMPTLKYCHSANKKTATNPDYLFCKVCNLALTSVQHAQQHYMGRNHLRVLNGHRPLKTHFNKETGKWQRVTSAESDPTGRFGIGSGFLAPNSDPLGLLDEAPSTSITVEDTKSINMNRKFFCDLCQVATTSQDQLDMHLKGAKHRKAEKASASRKASQGITSATATPSDSILASVIHNKMDKIQASVKDYSIYRTPSGQYYCQPCNLTLNTESQFSQHCESKKHKLALLKKPAGKGAAKSAPVIKP